MKIKLTDLDLKPIDFTQLLLPNKHQLFLLYHQFCLGCTGRAIPFAWSVAQEFPWLNVNLVHTNLGQQTFSKTELLSIFVDQKSPLPIYIDHEHLMYDLYQAEGTPTWLIFDKKGELIKHVFGSQANAKNRLLYFLDELERK
ncbi:MAG: hypothetical protein LAT51_03940 [Flavobacteriaceae bacterium]|nr:hypothetical protein [Flavobacteriaceae bacterium]